MEKRRVVITGLGAVSPYGLGHTALWDGLTQNICSLTQLTEEEAKKFNFKCAGKVPPFNEKVIPREIRRAMSPMSIYACLSAWEALADAGYTLENLPHNLGVCASSTLGSTFALEDFFREYILHGNIDSIKTSVFFKVMSHTVATNIAMACKLQSSLLSLSAACATSLVSIGQAYESILLGKEECMLAGGADEYHVLTSATFDKLGAASYSSDAQQASRPFDEQRDGLVISEGAGIVFVESLESALKRKAHIYAEIKGYTSLCSSKNIAFPDSEVMAQCMRKSLAQAEMEASQIDYINAHATATKAGDIAESQAIGKVFSSDTPVSSLKGFMGHTLAASGVLELIASIKMMQSSLLIPNFNLNKVDKECAALLFLRKQEKKEITTIMKNSFALGGIYASLVFSKYK